MACGGEVPDPDQLRDWVMDSLRHLGVPEPAEICVRVVDAEEGAALNRAHRNREGPTNVLAFPGMAPLLGDIVLCADVVHSEASAAGRPVEHHWAHLCVHAVLHLLGHTHDAEDSAEAMENLEREILAGWGIPDPYRGVGQAAG
ncbi:MAG: rRNA maturation RNase YbeY [Gammaproteobacteria bacterium AqS3]|nr:rRNA maturation RNase YbeY [Gammaproteobacteria bacterium AqS3]